MGIKKYNNGGHLQLYCTSRHLIPTLVMATLTTAQAVVTEVGFE